MPARKAPQIVDMPRATSKKYSLNPLRREYRHLLSASVLAHARYLAAIGEKRFTDRHVLQQKAAWQSMEARRNRMEARLTLLNIEIKPSKSGIRHDI